MSNWPKQSDVLAYRSVYGDPRGSNGKSSPKWETANIVRISPPFAMKMGDIKITKIPIHKFCADSLSRILNDIWERSGKSQAVVDKWGISEFSGSLNFRVMRGLNTLSMHSFGCAIDFDAAEIS